MAAESGTYDPETVARHQAIAAQLLKQSAAPREIRSRLQGVGQLGEGLLAGIQSGMADKEAKEGRAEAVAQALAAFGGGGQTPAAGAAAPTPVAPTAAPVATSDAAAPPPVAVGSSDTGQVPIGSSRAASNVPTPEQYRPIVDQASVANGVNPETMARLLNQESGFKPSIVSPAGARGIAQFMPSTAKQYGVNPDDPNSAIPGAAKYLSDVTKQFGGNEGLGLMAYNWGPGNVQKWIAGGSDPSRVPVETQNYVKSITGQPVQAYVRIAGALNPGGSGGDAPEPAGAPPVAGALSAPTQVTQNAPATTAGPPGGRAAAIAAMLNPWTPPAMASALASQLNPSYGFQTLPDGTIIRTDPKSGTVQPIYQAATKPTWGVIGEDNFGNKQYGWIDAVHQKTTAGAPAGGGATGTPTAPLTITGPDGKPIEIPPGQDPKKFREHVTAATADAKVGKLTEAQVNATQFANRMEDAEKNLKGVEDQAGGVSGAAQQVAGKIPVVGSAMQTKDYQKFSQAKSQFITALLRKESGAAIGNQEFERYDREFFPQPGDAPDVIAQKSNARRVAIEAMKKGAGPIYESPKTSAPSEASQGGLPSGWSVKVH